MAERPSTSGLQEGYELLCQFCWKGNEVEDIAGKLHAEKSETSSKMVAAHHKCMQYASGLTQYKFSLFGGFDIFDVEKEIHRGSKLKCFICRGEKGKGKKATGAVCGCAIKSCRKTFHFVCAFQNDVAITKRLVVTQNKQSKKYVLYRVFCSAVHEAAFRTNLKEELRLKKKLTDSSSGDESYNHSASTPPSSKSASASNSFNSSFINIGSPLLSPPAAERVLKPVTSIQNSPLPNDTGACCEGNTPMENGDENQEESDPTVSSSGMPTTSRQSKDRRKSGSFRGRSRQSKLQASQPPQCSPIAEEANEQNQSGESSLTSKATESDTSSVVQKDVSVVLEHLGDLLVPAATASPGKSPVRSALASPRKGAATGNAVASLELVNGSAVSASPRKTVFLTPSKAAPKASPSRPTSSDLQNGLRSATPTKSADGRPSPARASPRYVSLSPSRSSVRLSPFTYRDAQVASPNKVGVLPTQHSVTQNLVEGTLQSPKASGDAPAEHDEENMEVSTALVSADVSEKSAADCLETLGNHVTADVTGPTNAGELAPQGSRGRGRPRKQPVDGMLHSETELSAQETGDNSDGEAHGRKRKLQRVQSGDDIYDGVTDKVARRSKDEDSWQACVILLLPAASGQNKTESFQQLVATSMNVKVEEVWAWQKLRPDFETVLPSGGHVFFALDVVKSLVSGDSSELQALLFDVDRLVKQADSYRKQVQVIEELGDAKAEKDMLDAVLACVERKVKLTPANKWQAARLFHNQGCSMLALDLRVCDHDRHIRARIGAHNGLYRWMETTVADGFPTLSMESRHQAAEIESLMLTVWFHEVCKVGEVLVYPQDANLLDTTVPETSTKLSALVETLQTKIAPAIDASPTTGRTRRQSLSPKAPVLMVFQPVDFEVVNFQQYFQKSLRRFLHDRPEVSTLLALVPTTNLHPVTAEAVTALVGAPGGIRSGLRMEMFSAFCPTADPITLVVVKMSAQSGSTGLMEVNSSPQSKTGAVQKRRGRPPKKKPALVSSHQ